MRNFLKISNYIPNWGSKAYRCAGRTKGGRKQRKPQCQEDLAESVKENAPREEGGKTWDRDWGVTSSPTATCNSPALIARQWTQPCVLRLQRGPVNGVWQQNQEAVPPLTSQKSTILWATGREGLGARQLAKDLLFRWIETGAKESAARICGEWNPGLDVWGPTSYHLWPTEIPGVDFSGMACMFQWVEIMASKIGLYPL